MTVGGRMCCGVEGKLLGARFICRGGGESEAAGGVGASLRRKLF
jgi:hypothetical protein